MCILPEEDRKGITTPISHSYSVRRLDRWHRGSARVSARGCRLEADGRDQHTMPGSSWRHRHGSRTNGVRRAGRHPVNSQASLTLVSLPLYVKIALAGGKVYCIWSSLKVL